MGGALLGGILKSGVARAEDIVATSASAKRAADVTARYGVRAEAHANLKAASESDIVILAVKPGKMTGVIEEIRPGLRAGQLLISLAAAYPIELIERFAQIPLAIFRAMPNIPVIVEEGATGITRNGHSTIEQA